MVVFDVVRGRNVLLEGIRESLVYDKYMGVVCIEMIV